MLCFDIHVARWPSLQTETSSRRRRPLRWARRDDIMVGVGGRSNSRLDSTRRTVFNTPLRLCGKVCSWLVVILRVYAYAARYIVLIDRGSLMTVCKHSQSRRTVRAYWLRSSAKGSSQLGSLRVPHRCKVRYSKSMYLTVAGAFNVSRFFLPFITLHVFVIVVMVLKPTLRKSRAMRLLQFWLKK